MARSTLVKTLCLLTIGTTASAGPTVDTVKCSLGGEAIRFIELPSRGSPMIKLGEARLGESAKLLYSFSPYYGAGGLVRLQTSEIDLVLLRWDSEHADELAHSALFYKGRRLECGL